MSCPQLLSPYQRRMEKRGRNDRSGSVRRKEQTAEKITFAHQIHCDGLQMYENTLTRWDGFCLVFIVIRAASSAMDQMSAGPHFIPAAGIMRWQSYQMQ